MSAESLTEKDLKNLVDLANGLIEKTLGASERERLEDWVTRDPVARRALADILHDHAVLYWGEAGGGSFGGIEAGGLEELEMAGSPEETEPPGKGDRIPAFSPLPRRRERGRPFPWLKIAAVLALSAIGVWLVRSSTAPPEDASFAEMVKTQAARWQSADLPTSRGARLGEGTLDLAEGLATLRFDSGAEVVLEAPVRLRLVDAMRCELLAGTAVAEVPESAHGFRLDTPSAQVIDHGTRFAVNVDERSGQTRTQVFEGLVEVGLPGAGNGGFVELGSGERNLVSRGVLGPASFGPDESDWQTGPDSRTERRGPGWRRVTTAAGRGMDNYVAAIDIENRYTDELLLLKNGLEESGAHRKSYLRFDLSSAGGGEISAAALELHFAPTGWGLASHTPDAEFAVYGLGDDAMDEWSRKDMTWENAPGNAVGSGAALQEDAAVLLGTFTVPQGVQRGAFGIEGEALAEFLREDGNRLSTFVVVRLTRESKGGGLVHGVASRRHPVLPPPTLWVKR